MIKYIDKPIEIITNYVKENVNRLAIDSLKMELINTVEYYDVQLTPNINYPLLKGFRTAELLLPNSSKTRSSCILRYCLAHEAIDQISPLVGLVSKFIHISLNDFHSKTQRVVYLVDDTNRPRRSEYRTLYQESSNAVYAFLNIYFEIEEGLYNYSDWSV